MSRVATKIKEARIKAKLTEKELAKKCGLTASYIIQIESGKKVVNEKLAENILKALGEKLEFMNLEDTAEERDKEAKEKELKEKKAQTIKKEEFYNVEPTEQWSDALANIIKKFPIYDINSNKIMGYKELPVIGKKIEGYNWDKILFVQVSDHDMEEFRIKKNDVIMIQITNEIQNNSLYLCEMDNKRIVRQLRKESNNRVIISTGLKNSNPITTELNKIKLLGKCVKVEFDLDKK